MRKTSIFFTLISCAVLFGCSSPSGDSGDERLAISAEIIKTELPSIPCDIKYSVILFRGSSPVIGADVQITGHNDSPQTLNGNQYGQYEATITEDIDDVYVAGESFEISITADGATYEATATAPGGDIQLNPGATEASWATDGNSDQIRILHNPNLGEETLGPDLASPAAIPATSYPAGAGAYSVYVQPTSRVVGCFSGDCHPTSYVLIRNTKIFHNVP